MIAFSLTTFEPSVATEESLIKFISYETIIDLDCYSLFSSPLFAQTEQALTPQWRPLYHFTPRTNWTNDPNGLIYINGVYHLYNQQNPFENKWGYMSWGHASSTDLVHWKHLPIAMPEAIENNGKDTHVEIFGLCGNG